MRAEADLVNLILSIVARHSAGGRLPERFLQHFNSKPQRSITDTLRCFKAFLQSENVAIAIQVSFAGKVIIDASKAHGYFEKPQISNTLEQKPVMNYAVGQ